MTGTFSGVDPARLHEARTVLALAPDLIGEVKLGQASLAEAYKTAQDRKKAREWKEKGLQQLRELAPDLAYRVEDDADKLTLNEARRSAGSRQGAAVDTRQRVHGAR